MLLHVGDVRASTHVGDGTNENLSFGAESAICPKKTVAGKYWVQG